MKRPMQGREREVWEEEAEVEGKGRDKEGRGGTRSEGEVG